MQVRENIILTVKSNYRVIALDVLLLAIIYYLPTISHLTAIPFYLFEPMRFFVLISLVSGKRWNSYFLALTLSLFSFAITSHPAGWKSLIILIELTSNVYLFGLFSKRIKNLFLSVVGSIIASKLIYYFLKIIFVKNNLIDGDIISTPLLIQFASTIVFSGIVYFLFKKIKNNY